MLGNMLESVTLTDLQALVTDAIPEGKTIEYKRDFYRLDVGDPAYQTKQYKELLKDVSSFANTLGGDLIIGIEEADGVATNVCGFAQEDPDVLKRKISEIVQNGLEPRISMAIHAVSHSAGRFVFIVRIRRSMVAPHRVVYHKTFGPFWARNSAGAYEMDTSELRQSFNLSETINARIKNFRIERVRAITEGQTPVVLTESPKLICHLIPLESFTSHVQYNTDTMANLTVKLPLLRGGGWSHRYNLDGMVTFDGQEDQASSGYVQLFRNGVIESVLAEVAYSPSEKTVRYFRTSDEENLINKLPDYVAALRALGVPSPVWLFLTLTGVKGVRIVDADYTASAIDRDTLYLPELEIPDQESIEYGSFLRPLFDMIWNAAGHRRCLDYDDKGKFSLQRR